MFCQSGSNSDVFFLFMRGERIKIPLKMGHHRPAIEMAFRWRADDGSTLNAGLILQGIRISIAKKSYIFVIFQGESRMQHRPPKYISRRESRQQLL